MKRLRNLSIGCALAIAASLALARVHPFGDAGLHEASSAGAPVLSKAQIPYQARSILVEKCADCHSDRTNAPAYGYFAPVSWLMERDITEARKAMNLSQWDTYSAEQQQTLLARVVHETRLRQMPPVQYRIIHWNARITDADLNTLDRLAPVPQSSQTGSSSSADGNPEQGKVLFEKRCAGCHTMAENREGPRLQGVYGRTSGTLADFAYSDALKKAHIVWDSSSLDKWLGDPDTLVPGNGMDFLVPNPQERRDLISFLKQSSGN